MKRTSFDAIVVGAGAAGMMCASVAAQRGARVLLNDHYHKLGEKIRISGGGRCNFTNIHTRPENFLSQNPHYCRSALARYTPNDFIKLVESHNIAYHEKTLGQLFCDDSASAIIRMLKAECDKGAVEWRMPASVKSIEHSGMHFRVQLEGELLESRALVIATGGLSVPKIGATPFGYQIAEQFGLKMVPPKPALVPLAFPPEELERFGDLSGVSLDAVTSCAGGQFREAILLTHRGLSGPAILQISSYWQAAGAKEPIHLNVLPDAAAIATIMRGRNSKVQFHNLLAETMPRRFAESWCNAMRIDQPANQFNETAFHRALDDLQDWKVRPSGTLGYNKAEVTLGGVDTRGLSSKTMAATHMPNLYFVGEVVDVTGHLGGFNFQWAWASGHAAGCAIAEAKQ
ncbi:MAG: NAD(P)/FAD-dependent oxidoreductase [Burkholderiales bacterium]|jgi:predicted Rossmann fold flavoprotein|nr:NAD(P)/FAD-dependent oxidoreductase [Nitrosomonadaceae bacterium]